MLRTVLTGCALAVLTLRPATGQGGNGVHPRTPVLWVWSDEVVEPGGTPQPTGTGTVPCITTVDRSIDPVLRLDYRIPYEDANTTSDEVDDSRRHQFLALRSTGRRVGDSTPFECPIVHPQAPPLSWLNGADLRAAAQKRLLGPVGPDHKTPDPAAACCGVLPDEVLELNPAWAGCWARITQNTERRPITFAAAAQPVRWDTTHVAAGIYLVYGYTWEPLFNMWRRRPGVVKVVDGPDPADSAPALSVSVTPNAVGGTDPIFFPDEMATFDLCVDAMDGSQVTLSYALTDMDDEWVEVLADEPVTAGLRRPIRTT